MLAWGMNWTSRKEAVPDECCAFHTWCSQMYLEEGRRIREAAEIEKARLASIKARKLKDLEDAGEHMLNISRRHFFLSL